MAIFPQEIIRRKRDGEELDRSEIADFIRGLAREEISEGQVAAFAMAVFFQGMSRNETIALTSAMRDSGDVLNWDIGRPIADKHSTGGVGDNVSLMLAPVVAACGVSVPMISGRGLGHTGGTLDKLQAIPGYNVTPDAAHLKDVVADVGCAIVGQTESLVPADRRLYAIRDVTATVESQPLITGSILSKKLAAGVQTLVLDVKVGNGAFMESIEDAEALARSLVEVANGAGMRTTALLTDMNQPLADAVGNSLEVINCLDFLNGRKTETRLHAVVLALASEMLVQAGIASTLEDARPAIIHAIDDGRALEVFARMVAALGGPLDFVEKPSNYLRKAKTMIEIQALEDGWVSACATRQIGQAVVELGGGRKHPHDKIDPAVGLDRLLPLGSRVTKGEPLAVVHAADRDRGELVARAVASSIAISHEAPVTTDVVVSRIT